MHARIIHIGNHPGREIRECTHAHKKYKCKKAYAYAHTGALIAWILAGERGRCQKHASRRIIQTHTYAHTYICIQTFLHRVLLVQCGTCHMYAASDKSRKHMYKCINACIRTGTFINRVLLGRCGTCHMYAFRRIPSSVSDQNPKFCAYSCC
jgi:hypothetical protein